LKNAEEMGKLGGVSADSKSLGRETFYFIQQMLHNGSFKFPTYESIDKKYMEAKSQKESRWNLFKHSKNC